MPGGIGTFGLLLGLDLIAETDDPIACVSLVRAP
jgi:hypothetical protein